MQADYTGKGFDQLLDVIDKIKNKPDDRRIILSAWNPSDLELMALPPCHMFAQVNNNLLLLLLWNMTDLISSIIVIFFSLGHVCITSMENMFLGQYRV